jgi:hypothetical protein
MQRYTGIVFNPFATVFVCPMANPLFIFDGEDGGISA